MSVETIIEPEPRLTTAPAPAPRRFPPIELLPPLLFALTLALAIPHAWRKSLDPIIDFGRELYTPTQLASGKTLYTDLAAFYGPLSQYTNALAFKLFGPGLSTLLALNTIILLIATTLLYLLLRQLTTRLAATVATLLFILIFATAHIGAVGNFNFLTPYSHEATHGLTLSLAALCAFTRFTNTRRTRYLTIAAFCAGLVLMTKPEIALALLGSLLIGATLTLRSSRFSVQTLLAAAASFLLPLALMTIFLATKSPPLEAFKQTFGAYLFVSNGSLLQSRFYANSMGLENPAGQLTLILTTALRYAAILLPPFLAAFFIKNKLAAPAVGLALAILAAAALGLQWWVHASEILLLATLLIAIPQLPTLLKKNSPRHIPLATLTAFSLLILLKMLLHTRFHQYGFILAIAPTALLVITLLDRIPAWLQTRHADPWTFRAPALALLAMLAVVSLTVSARNLAQQNNKIPAGPNTFFTDDRAPILNDTLAWLQQNTTEDQTLTVLPEGLLLNVLSHRRTSIPYLSALPSDITMFSEPKILAALQQNPPTFIAITHRPASDFGQENFGADYALTLRTWITQNYHPTHLAGPIPYTTENFGILILQRNP